MGQMISMKIATIGLLALVSIGVFHAAEAKGARVPFRLMEFKASTSVPVFARNFSARLYVRQPTSKLSIFIHGGGCR